MLPGPTGRLAEPLLYVAVRGTCTITVGDVDCSIATGDALWVPAGSIVDATHGSEPGIVLPVPGHASGPAVIAQIPGAIEHLPVLLEAFSRGLGHLDDGSARGVSVRLDESALLEPPPAPVSAELHDLADTLADNPDLDLAAALDAAVTGWSMRSVQRRFRAETGLSLTAWVRRARIHAAAELLRSGRDLEWTAHRVGFRSVPGFVRAFREIAGSPPGEWRRTATGAEFTRAQIIPTVALAETRTWERVNGAHVAVWAALGVVDVIIGGRPMRLCEGDAVVLPAGLRNRVTVPAGSLMLPIGYRSGRAGAVGMPLAPVQVAPRLDIEAIGWMIDAYARPGATGTGAEGVEAGFASVLRGGSLAPTDTDDHRLAALASAVSLRPEWSFTDIAALLDDSERDLRRLVRERAGESSATWLRAARMTRARNRLNEGQAASRISRDLGYAHLPAFSRAFREVHGAGPATVPLTDISKVWPSAGAGPVS